MRIDDARVVEEPREVGERLDGRAAGAGCRGCGLDSSTTVTRLRLRPARGGPGGVPGPEADDRHPARGGVHDRRHGAERRVGAAEGQPAVALAVDRQAEAPARLLRLLGQGDDARSRPRRRAPVVVRPAGRGGAARAPPRRAGRPRGPRSGGAAPRTPVRSAASRGRRRRRRPGRGARRVAAVPERSARPRGPRAGCPRRTRRCWRPGAGPPCARCPHVVVDRPLQHREGEAHEDGGQAEEEERQEEVEPRDLRAVARVAEGEEPVAPPVAP